VGRPEPQPGSGAALPPFQLGYRETRLRRDLVAAVLDGPQDGHVEPSRGVREILPAVGQRGLLVEFAERPVGVVEVTDVRVIRVADVDVDFARDEGEGFVSVAEWRAAHEAFWAGHTVTDDTLVVYELFRLLERF